MSRSAGVGLVIESFLCSRQNKSFSIKKSLIKRFPRYKPNIEIFEKIVNVK